MTDTVWIIGFDQEVFGIYKTKESAEKGLKEQIESGGPAWDDCSIWEVNVKE